VEVAEKSGCPKAVLVQRASDIPWEIFSNIKTLGITAGASAPEVLVNEMVTAFRERFNVTVEEVITARENIAFNVPRELREIAAATVSPPAN
jgi:4-hydroxy-3-methylbut-2-en-1-yl diphosphate reductase